MKKNKFLLGFLVICVLLFSSCRAAKHVPMFQNVTPETEHYQLASHYNLEQIIRPGDVLNINITSLSASVNELKGGGMGIFNKKDMSTVFFGKGVQNDLGDQNNNNIGQNYYSEYKLKNYLVDDAGYIVIPIIGNIKVAGLTWIKAKDLISENLKKYESEPLVELNNSFLKVTIIGEVKEPGVITALNDRMSILEALGRVGDMTIFGNRRHVVVVRSNGNNIEFGRFDFTKKDILTSPYYWLRNNDVIYIAPNKTKSRSAGYGQLESMTLSLVTLGLSIITFIRSFR